MKSYLALFALALVCGNSPSAAFAPPQRPAFFFSTKLYSAFRPKQNKGESDMDFTKRITNQGGHTANQTNKMAMDEISENNNDSEETPKKVGKYQPIEEWDAERKLKGEMSWEERCQFDGQQFGDQVQQDTILRRQLNSPF
jgi:hypothetical protein